MAVLLPMVMGAMNFQIPNKEQRLEAIGSTAGLPPILQRAFAPASDFEPLPAPGSSDWLAVHPEPGQSFEQFVRSGPNRPDRKRNILYLQPLGEFRAGAAPPLESLREYAAAYFALEVRVLPSLSLNQENSTTRRNPATGNRQLLTTDILAALKKRITEDAFCLLGITMEDLYPEPSWNFVFGQASLRERVGVYSFARYDPAFYGAPRGDDYLQTLLRRSAKVLVHETGHMFGLAHCICFRCVFNGSNHLDESDARPLHECPVDLRKLHHSIGFDVPQRYARLYRFYGKVGFEDEAAWTRRRLEGIVGREEARKLVAAKEEDAKS
ncbi:MAG: archaemetzincin [Planctomycetes bacterium]|nr:archaemetzincin [Planctomycetota bacterium]